MHSVVKQKWHVSANKSNIDVRGHTVYVDAGAGIFPGNGRVLRWINADLLADLLDEHWDDL